MTTEEIEFAIADAKDWCKINGAHVTTGGRLAGHVLALAEECKRLRGIRPEPPGLQAVLVAVILEAVVVGAVAWMVGNR